MLTGEACGEIFPSPTGLAIYEAVKRELEHQESAKRGACGHAWKWHTSGGMCAGVDGQSECHCVMIREHPG